MAEDDISFEELPSLDGPNVALLPRNYAEVAGSEAIGRGNGRSRLLLALPFGKQPVRYTVIGADTLSDPARTVDFIARIDGFSLDPKDPGARFFLGPETDLAPFDPGKGELLEIIGQPWTLVQRRAITEAVVIIDAGIAFWNGRFRGKSGPRFRGMRYLDFDQPNAGLINELTDAEIGKLCALADSEGNAAVMRKLGDDFPFSVFGRAANPSSDGLWHGTAIADLAVGVTPDGEPSPADEIALFGLELPRAAIADYSGHTLTQMLAMILPAAIEMTGTGPLSERRLTIVMPLAFPGGPQDGSHPAARSIADALAATGREDIRLVLPAGNHLQDRCHARLPVQGQQSRVFWDLPPEDHSDNTVEMIGPAGQPVVLTIAAPGQSAGTAVTLKANSAYQVIWKGQRIGLLIRGPDTPQWSHSVLSLSGTAERAGLVTTPMGRWTLHNAGPGPLDLWLARDDRNPVADQGRPRRPSYFWDAAYKPTAPSGALLKTDDPGSAIDRTGTLSVLATVQSPAVLAVQAMERLGLGPEVPAGYSSQPRLGRSLTETALVDDGWPGRGTLAAANGGMRRVHVSGTSAAAGLKVRELVLPGVPVNP